MAGSRLERIGTIFSRATGLLRSEVLKYEDRPVWYDVYRVFPPTLEPLFDREPVLPPGMPPEVPEIFYEEDGERATVAVAMSPKPAGPKPLTKEDIQRFQASLTVSSTKGSQ